MRFVQHNFNMNFLNATGANDKKLSINLLAQEIVEIAKSNPALLIALLQQNAIQINPKSDIKQIVKLVTSNIVNPKIQSGIANIITNKYSKGIVKKKI